MEDNGARAVWTKIDEEGVDGSSWAVDKLIANKGKKDFTIPSDLKAGKYMSKHLYATPSHMLHEIRRPLFPPSDKNAATYIP